MNEGEFHKQIKELFKLGEAPSWSDKALVRTFTVYVETKKNALLNLIEEAKKEVPLKYEDDEWKKKWFGEAERRE